jgi:prepilin-type N-terminal cleavage/methylation domain-containing protein
MRGARAERGFTLIELLVAALLVAIITLGLFQFAVHAMRSARVRPDAADLQQRLRVAVDMMRRDIARAGSGLIHGPDAGSLARFLPPIVPARTGALSPDGEMSAFADRISIVYVPDGGWSSRLWTDMAGAAADVPVDAAPPGCPPAGLCGFEVGTRAALVDTSGIGVGRELFSVTGIAAGLGHASPNPSFLRPYSRDRTLVIPIAQRVYYIDRATRRLMVYDGHVTDVPLVDHVVDLGFTYYADPDPSAVVQPPPGQSSCLFAAGDPPLPLLVDLGGVSLRPLALEQMRDGPSCGPAPHRFDGDLLRIRRVRVTIRLEAAADELRGSGAGFSRAGRSPDGDRYVPDYQVAFDVSVPNLVPIR